MLNGIKSLASAGASPFTSRVMMYVIGGLLVFMLVGGGYLGYKLYTSQKEITTLTQENTQLRANVQTLKANQKKLNTALTQQKQAYSQLQAQHKTTLKIYEKLRNRMEDEREKKEAFRKQLKKLKRENDEYEAFLNTRLPNPIVDAVNELLRESGQSGTSDNNSKRKGTD